MWRPAPPDAGGSDKVTLIPLVEVGNADTMPVVQIPGGRTTPDQAVLSGPADAIAASPEPKSVLVANPADRAVYYDRAGMSAPMGTFYNERRAPIAVQPVDRGLRETAPGVNATSIQLTAGDVYDVAFILDSPHVTGCFELAVEAQSARGGAGDIQVTYLIGDAPISSRSRVHRAV